MPRRPPWKEERDEGGCDHKGSRESRAESSNSRSSWGWAEDPGAQQGARGSKGSKGSKKGSKGSRGLAEKVRLHLLQERRQSRTRQKLRKRSAEDKERSPQAKKSSLSLTIQSSGRLESVERWQKETRRPQNQEKGRLQSQEEKEEIPSGKKSQKRRKKALKRKW